MDRNNIADRNGPRLSSFLSYGIVVFIKIDDFRNSWIFHGCHGDPMGPHGTPWDPWGPMGIHGDPWEPMGTHGNPWEPMGTHGNPWEPMGTHGDPWGPMGTHGDPWDHQPFYQTCQNPYSWKAIWGSWCFPTSSEIKLKKDCVFMLYLREFV